MTERPLVTFVVIAYNQERFIREAIEGAFAQTYQPLEIILSDDCSPDRTFEIMQEMAAAYEGPHKLVLNRNSVNQGLVPHIDRVMEIVSGEFIVVNAGDDVSIPERTERLTQLWLQSNGHIRLVHSAAVRIDKQGNALERKEPPAFMRKFPTASEILEHKGFIIGATAAWDKTVYSCFGPLGEKITTEDVIIPVRASIIGSIAYISEPLVRWRVGGVSFAPKEMSAHEYLYGSSHKGRVWWREIYDYIIRNNCSLGSKNIFDAISLYIKRKDLLDFSVRLADASRVKRLSMVFRAFYLGFSYGEIGPIKDWLRYTFDRLYIIYADWRVSRQRRVSSASPHVAKDG